MVLSLARSYLEFLQCLLDAVLDWVSEVSFGQSPQKRFVSRALGALEILASDSALCGCCCAGRFAQPLFGFAALLVLPWPSHSPSRTVCSGRHGNVATRTSLDYVPKRFPQLQPGRTANRALPKLLRTLSLPHTPWQPARSTLSAPPCPSHRSRPSAAIRAGQSSGKRSQRSPETLRNARLSLPGNSSGRVDLASCIASLEADKDVLATIFTNEGGWKSIIRSG